MTQKKRKIIPKRTRKRISGKKAKNQFPPFFWIVLIFLVGTIFTFAFFSLTNSTQEVKAPVEAEDQAEKDFIEALRPHAQEIQTQYGILASITIGQAILESDWGNSQLSKTYKNLYGIKAYGDENKILLDTQEFVNNEWVTVQAYFKVYDSWDDSMDDHTQLFLTGVSWDNNLYQGVLTADTYKTAATELQEAGYATDPDYAEKIIGVIESWNLQQYDQLSN